MISIRSVSAGDRFLWAAAEDHRENQHHDTRIVGKVRGRRTFRELLELSKLSGVENLRLFLNLVMFGDPGPELYSGG